VVAQGKPPTNSFFDIEQNLSNTQTRKSEKGSRRVAGFVDRKILGFA
jgi:hypothetical protein